ncbi:MAG: class I SAM-dependent methyltransferase [Clostridiaceae bacterium]|jgi:ubiquinone/menaquinone biosynthesis C-methylase UbiE|nr:class I SAM-dependent methyltransferase [Clostridiaceae bacterium]
MFHEPPTLEVCINRVAVKTFARRYYKDLVNAVNLKGNERVLDFGSGAGGPAVFIAKQLEKAGGWLTCVDVSHKWIRCAKRNLQAYRNVDFKLGYIGDVDIQENSYDMINIHFVMHEIPVESRSETAAVLYKKLKKGGLVFMREPVYDDNAIKELVALFEKQGMKKKYIKEITVPVSGESFEVCLEK